MDFENEDTMEIESTKESVDPGELLEHFIAGLFDPGNGEFPDIPSDQADNLKPSLDEFFSSFPARSLAGLRDFLQAKLSQSVDFRRSFRLFLDSVETP